MPRIGTAAADGGVLTSVWMRSRYAAFRQFASLHGLRTSLSQVRCCCLSVSGCDELLSPFAYAAARSSSALDRVASEHIRRSTLVDAFEQSKAAAYIVGATSKINSDVAFARWCTIPSMSKLGISRKNAGRASGRNPRGCSSRPIQGISGTSHRQLDEDILGSDLAS